MPPGEDAQWGMWWKKPQGGVKVWFGCTGGIERSESQGQRRERRARGGEERAGASGPEGAQREAEDSCTQQKGARRETNEVLVGKEWV